jgi:selenocysteine-specific elongation factor
VADDGRELIGRRERAEPVHWIVGTAGHIDHGKTSLVKALTGQDTDRLKEEKERGISIDLGFARLDLPDGRRAGVVDVPGHERFIRNMLAGAHGIDLVLFTVAADDGVMPQTEEHLDIVHLLGVSRAIFVVTKADLVSDARVREVAAEIRALAAGSSLAGSPITPFSSVTGAGLEALRDLIVEALRDGSRVDPVGYFRMPVDRAFAAQGHGLIVTGTVVNGDVRPGDRVRCLPGDRLLRVRNVEVHGEAAGVARSGQRVALNVTGSDTGAIVRGDVIAHERITLACDRFDVRIEIRSGARSAVKAHQRVRVYAGTAERLGRIIPLGSPARPEAETMAAGETAFAQIAVTEPLHVLRGDRCVLRDETARRTLGGGLVVRVAALKHKRSDPVLLSDLGVLDTGGDSAVAEVLIRESTEFTITLARLAQLMNRREDAVRSALDGSGIVRAFNVDGDIRYALQRECQQIRSSLVETLRAWHAAHPLAAGMEMEEARSSLRARIVPKVFRQLVEDFTRDGSLARDGSLLRLPDHRLEVPDERVERLMALLSRTPLAPPDLKQLTELLALDARALLEILRAMEKRRLVVPVAPDLFFSRETVDRVRRELIDELTATGGMTTADFRNRYKTSRKYAIPLLEWFDREGLTLRTGETRRLRPPRATDTP